MMSYVTMKRTTIFLSEEVDSDLKGLSRRRGLPVAEMVREALHEYVAREKARPTKMPRFAGIGASGRSDVAERHDDHLWRDLTVHEGSGEKPASGSKVRTTTDAARRRR